MTIASYCSDSGITTSTAARFAAETSLGCPAFLECLAVKVFAALLARKNAGQTQLPGIFWSGFGLLGERLLATFDPGPLRLEERRQRQALAQSVEWLVHGETRSVSSDLE